MSPEQVQGDTVDHRTDIFSLGVLIYEMATGDRPFQGQNSAQVVSSILRDDPPSVADRKAEMPFHLTRIVKHCLEKDPKRRSSLGLAYAALDRKDEALEAGRNAVELYTISDDALLGADRIWDLARISTLVGEDDLALDQIAILHSVPTVYSASWLLNEPSFRSLHLNPRFQSFVGTSAL